MAFILLFLNSLTLIQQSTTSTLSDTLYIFNAVDSTYSTEFVEGHLDTTKSLHTTDYYIPAERYLKGFEFSAEKFQNDSLSFQDFEVISEGEQELYPLSAAVKLFIVKEDSAVSKCSGMMVSEKHVLTAAHCIYSNELFSEIYAYAGYHKDGLNRIYQVTRAVKYYTTIDVYHGESFFNNDIALLELEKNVGEGSGWIGLGYSPNRHDFLHNRIVMSLGYPASVNIADTTKVFSGEDMVYGYGLAHIQDRDNHKIEIASVATVGQSGSSLLIVDKQLGYFSIGAMSFVNLRNTSFQSLEAFTYLAFKDIIDNATTSTEKENELVSSLKLHQNFPNPFNPTTHIPFEVTKTQQISLTIFDITGRKVATLISRERKSPGNYMVPFDADGLSSGIYFYVLQGEHLQVSKKLLLIE